ncbi:hypothetical protein A33Q_1697 [Indibacter alkaliphilus LW1]|uniref:Uncharacterized protein n=1 Tax=Indibacter alkaliphilus (strain CCUG 57479 / KCTC 22604 / LW1) TaxID=1189612 RepID=S2DFL1_INDAL|nr:hypothetical protein A33Q_1697 [Indibacter alkaliphilus LW1]
MLIFRKTYPFVSFIFLFVSFFSYPFRERPELKKRIVEGR